MPKNVEAKEFSVKVSDTCPICERKWYAGEYWVRYCFPCKLSCEVDTAEEIKGMIGYDHKEWDPEEFERFLKLRSFK